MKLAILSDTHDHIKHLRMALSVIKNKGADAIIHCGDFVAPFMVDEISRAGLPVYGVFGNNDGDRVKLKKNAREAKGSIIIGSDVTRCALGGKRIAITHFKETATDLASSGNYDLVCFGHTHRYSFSKINGCILLNPGEMMGKKEEIGFCFFETDTGIIEHIIFETPDIYDKTKATDPPVSIKNVVELKS